MTGIVNYGRLCLISIGAAMHRQYNRVPADAFQRLNDLDIVVTSKVKRGTRGFGRLKIQVRLSRRSVCNEANSATNTLIKLRSGETTRHQLGSNKNNLLRVCMRPTVTSADRVQKPATLCLINTRSLRSNANVICDYVLEHDLDIVCVTETWLTWRDANSCMSTIPGYTLEHIPRCNRSGGGVGVLFKDGLRLASSKPWLADSFECVEVVLCGLTASSALRLFVMDVTRGPFPLSC